MLASITEAKPAADAASSASKLAITRLSYHVAAIVTTKPYSEAFFVATVVQRMPQPPADKHHLPRHFAKLDRCPKSTPRLPILDTVAKLLIATIVEKQQRLMKQPEHESSSWLNLQDGQGQGLIVEEQF